MIICGGGPSLTVIAVLSEPKASWIAGKAVLTTAGRPPCVSSIAFRTAGAIPNATTSSTAARSVSSLPLRPAGCLASAVILGEAQKGVQTLRTRRDEERDLT